MSNNLKSLKVLDELYRLKALGVSYIDPILIEHDVDDELPNDFFELKEIVQKCHLCELNKHSKQSLYGYGNENANIVFIDMMVSSDNDISNGYYNGKSGEMLKNMIQNVLHVTIDDVYITSAIKCFSNTKDYNSYFDMCKSYLFKQLELIKPKLIVALGEDTYKFLSGDHSSFESVRGMKIKFKNYDMISIYHPSFMLRNPSKKRDVMHDLSIIKGYL
jgi:uracil-DNA glycosylase family 4